MSRRRIAPSTFRHRPYWLGLTKPQIRLLANGRVTVALRRMAQQCYSPGFIRGGRKP